MNSLLTKTEKPEYKLRQKWSKLVNENGKPDANQHLEYILIRGVLATKPETIEQKVARIKRAFPKPWRYNLQSVLYAYRYRSFSAHDFCSPELYAEVKKAASEIYSAMYVRS